MVELTGNMNFLVDVAGNCKRGKRIEDTMQRWYQRHFLWQFFFLGAIGVTLLVSALLSGIVIATLLPVTESLAVLFFHERFPVEKGISLALSLWGFLSYFYGELQEIKKKKKEVELGSVCT